MTIRPINAYVLIKPAGTEEKTDGGIYLPDNAREKPQEGEVLAIAEDATDEVAVGDRVIHTQSTGTEITVDDNDCILVPSDALLAKYIAADEIPE